MSSASLSAIGSVSAPSVLTSLLANRTGGHSNTHMTVAELLRHQAQADVSPALGPLGAVGQLQTGGASSLQLAQLVLQQEQQRQQAQQVAAQTPRLHHVLTGSMLQHSGANTLTALSQAGVRESESALLDLLRQTAEHAPADTSKMHNNNQVLAQLGLTPMPGDHLGAATTGMAGLASLRMSGVSIPQASDYSHFGSSRGGVKSTSHGNLSGGRMSFSSVLSTGQSALGDQGEERLIQVGGQLVPAWMHANGDIRNGPSLQPPAAHEESAALMALAEFAHAGYCASDLEHLAEPPEGGAKGKRSGAPAAGKRRKQAKVPKLAGPVKLVATGGQGAQRTREGGSDTAESLHLQETASVLLSMASGENLPKFARDSSRVCGEVEDDALDPHKLLLHLQVVLSL